MQYLNWKIQHISRKILSSEQQQELTLPAQEIPDSDERKVFLYGQVNETKDEVLAYVTKTDTAGNEIEHEVGKLRIISYREEQNQMRIVPVNMDKSEINLALLADKINKIYSQSVAHWDITLDDRFDINTEDWDRDNNDVVDDSESALFANYTKEMNKIIRKYKKARDADKNTYYVLLLGNVNPESGDLAGYMPFKQQFGLIFIPVTGKDETHLARIVSHEIGHGAFRLYHTFSDRSTYIRSQGTTINLMDYNNGIHLNKFQWDQIHNPEGGMYLFQDEEEAAAYGNNCVFTQWIEKIRHTAQNNENINRNYGINEALKNIKLSDNSFYNDIRIYSRNGFNVSISEDNVKIHEYDRTGETLTYFQFGEQIATSSNIPVYELEIITPTENKDKLYKYLFDKENWESEVRSHFINKMIDGRSAAVKFLDCLPDEYYKDISLLHRMDILNTLNEANNISEKWFGSPNEEGVAIQIVKTTPANQVAELFNRLEQDGLIIDLYKKIDDVFGADNQTKFMCELLMLYYTQSQYYLKTCVEQTGLYCPWVKEDNYSYDYNTIFNDDKINITADYKYLLGGSGYDTENNIIVYNDLKPFTCIAVDFITIVDFIGIKGGADGKVVPMPVIFFKWLNDEVIEREIEEVTELAIKIGAVAIPGYQLATAKYAYETIGALIALIPTTGKLFNFTDNDCEKLISLIGEKGEVLCSLIEGLDIGSDIETVLKSVVQKKLPLFYILKSTWELVLDDPDLNIDEILEEDEIYKINKIINDIDQVLKSTE